MKFNNVMEAKQYLRSLDRIVIPKEYTYFIHCTAFQSLDDAAKNKYNKSWTELPHDQIVVRRELSCVEHRDHIHSALAYGGLDRAMTNYARHQGSKSFQIRIVIPNRQLTKEQIEMLGLDEEYCKKLFRTHTGGDGRHPKLWNNDVIELFATSIYDEVTKTKQDIFYGVRQEDIIKYAEIVSSEISINGNILMESIPTIRDDYYKWPNNVTYSLPKNQNDLRYQRSYIRGPNGDIQLTQFSPFEQEYYHEINTAIVSDEPFRR